MLCLRLVVSWTCGFSPARRWYLCQTFHLTDRVWQKRPRTPSVTSCSPEVTSWAILWTQPLQALSAARAFEHEALDDQGLVFVLSVHQKVLRNLSTTTRTLDPTLHRNQKYHKYSHHIFTEQNKKCRTKSYQEFFKSLNKYVTISPHKVCPLADKLILKISATQFQWQWVKRYPNPKQRS